jgi:hypothetical protein
VEQENFAIRATEATKCPLQIFTGSDEVFSGGFVTTWKDSREQRPTSGVAPPRIVENISRHADEPWQFRTSGNVVDSAPGDDEDGLHEFLDVGIFQGVRATTKIGANVGSEVVNQGPQSVLAC